MTASQSRDYRYYKDFQKRHQMSLDLANSPEFLYDLTIAELLKHYSFVKQLYQLRSNYREKYFSPDQWDEGHIQFFRYLLNILDIYEDVLKEKFEETIEIQETEQAVRRTSLNESDVTPSTQASSETRDSRKLIERILQEKRERAEFERQWELEVQQSMKEKLENTERLKKILLLFHRLLQNIKHDLTLSQSIDIAHYYQQSLLCISSVREKNVKSLRFASCGTVEYPRDIDEFSAEFSQDEDFNDRFLNMYRKFAFYNPKLLSILIDTVLEIVRRNPNYYIIVARLGETGNNENTYLIVPTIKETLTLTNTEGRAYFVSSDSDPHNFEIRAFNSNIFTDVIRVNYRNRR